MNKQAQNYLNGIMALLIMATAAVAADRSPLKWDRDVRNAWQAAIKAERPLLVFITMDGCIHCQKMKQTTLQDRQVVADLQTHFVPVSLNMKDAPELVEQLQVKSFPTTVVIQTNGDVIDTIAGFKSARQLRDRLQDTLRVASEERQQELQRR